MGSTAPTIISNQLTVNARSFRCKCFSLNNCYSSPRISSAHVQVFTVATGMRRYQTTVTVSTLLNYGLRPQQTEQEPRILVKEANETALGKHKCNASIFTRYQSRTVLQV